MTRTIRQAAILAALACLIGALLVSTAYASPIMPSRRHVFNGASTNWSGYAAETNLTSPQSGAVSDVKGTWQVPFVAGTSNAWSAAWVGIDGYSSSTVEQLGTLQDTGRRSASYSAWYEMYPAGLVTIPSFAVNPGNIISAEVRYAGSNKFVLSMTNTSTGKSFQTTQTATASRSSAEWVMEAPSSSSGVLPLANFGTINFSSCSATLNGTTGAISSWPYDPITMVTGGRRSVNKAVPSALSSGGNAFSVVWKHS